MKKTTLITTVVLLAVLSTVTHAGLVERQWSYSWDFLISSAPALTDTESDGDGAGWYATIYNSTDVAEVSGGTANTLGWATGFGYVVNDFNFDATEADSVVLRLYNNTVGSSAGVYSYIDSDIIVLSDIADDVNPPLSTEVTVSFDMSGSSWQAVPEPATAMLLALGGGLAWLVRLRQRSSY